ncbi:MAG: alpha/beta fold hydrolase [Actinomycetota bacterium]|nr:alpha/beta fold hydrolase [Actinomycetota bacterium]
MASKPVWLRSGNSSLFGWLDCPDDGLVRAAVILCPPLASELISAHETFLELSTALVERGFAVVRFDYPGTGDSTDVPDADDRVALWQDAIVAVSRWASDGGLDHQALVGMRMGATLLALERRLCDVDAAVLWDPCLRGRAFLRQHEALTRMLGSQLGVSSVPVDGCELPGYVYPRITVDRITNMTLLDAPLPLSDNTLVLLRDSMTLARVRAHFEGHGLQVEQITGQPELLDAATPESVIPHGSVRRIAGWLDEVMADDARLCRFPSTPTQAVVGPADIVERPVRLGPSGLFAMVTDSIDPKLSLRRPTVVFLNAAAEFHIGPARQWVELSRRLAGHGFRCLRIDLSGIGESPARAGQGRRRLYSPYALFDVAEVLQGATPDDPTNAVLVGLCSGAYAALESGAALGLRGVIAISPILDIEAPHEVDVVSAEMGDSDAGLNRPIMARPRTSYGSALLKHQRLKKAMLHFPTGMWRLAHGLRLQRSPADGFQSVVRQVDKTLVVCNSYDGRAYVERGQWIVDRLTASGKFHLEIFEMDHGLLSRSGRDRVADTTVANLLSWFPVPDQSDGHPVSELRSGRT